MATLRCKAPFAVFIGGVPRVVGAGELVDTSDPVVEGRDDMFELVDTFMSRHRPVEQATAAPGEARSLTVKRSTRKTS